jgi:hypothetical protein
MLSTETYKVVHLFGIFLMFTALAATFAHVANGGTREGSSLRRLLATMHGPGAFLVIVAGFGMFARLLAAGSISGMPGWVMVKLVLWLFLAVSLAIPYRKPAAARPLLLLLPLLGAMGGLLAVFKPF